MRLAHAPDLKTPFASEVVPVLRPVRDDDLADLQALLNRHQQAADPYQSSAAYFAMTGRDGLWLAEEKNTAILACRHPNDENTVLVFAPIGAVSSNLLARTIGEIAKTNVSVNLARADEATTARLMTGHPAIRAQRVTERILDWAYPVHVLDTAKVAAHKGNAFQQFRTKLNKLDGRRLHPIDLDPARHRAAITCILGAWAEGDRAKSVPYVRLLDLFDKLPMAGRLLIYDGQPAGFSIWETTAPRSGLANAYAHVGLHAIPGMARAVMLDMCRILMSRGYSRVCIGGSETAGLDQFKRQMRPVESLSLGTWRLAVKPQRPTARPAMSWCPVAIAANTRVDKSTPT